ncbi:MAG TPA: hypothetical protein VHQ22_22530 [Terriglobales bacterium]|nr:hypothetical protein [Terriglobales bacterium]
MRSPSPTAEGFHLIFRRPAIPLAEIAWRWSFASAFWFLSASFLVEYADSLPANRVDRLLLGTRQPELILRALHRMLHGSALRFSAGSIVLAIGLLVAWMFLSSLGRAATLNAMMETLEITPSVSTRRTIVSSLLALSFLRAANVLAAIVAAIGTVLVASGVWASTHMSGSGAARLWLLLLVLVWTAWAMLNWILLTSSLFVAVDHASALTAISSTLGWYRDRLGSVLAAGVWFGLIHGGAFLTAFSAAFTVLGMAQILGAGPALFLEIVIIAAYCAVADLLYIGRLTAYLAIIRRGDSFDLPEPEASPSISPSSERTAIDQSELILSDVRLPAT